VKNLLLKTLAVALLLLPVGKAVAQPAADAGDSKPVAVISLSGYTEVFSDLDFLGKQSERPDLASGLEGMLQLFTQGKGLQGLDKKRPWGAVIEVRNENEFVPLVFVPVSNLKQLLGSLAGVVGEAEEGTGGTYSLQAGPQRIYLKEQTGWAFVGQSADSLKTLPKNPLALLGGLEKSFDIGVRLHVRNIPEIYRDMALDQLKAGIESGLDTSQAGEGTDLEMRKQLVEAQLAQMDRMFNETDQLTFGASVDQKTKSAYFDMTITAVPDSKMAQQFAQIKDTTTAYGGFLLPNAAMTLASATKVDPQSAKESAAQLSAMRASIIKEIDKAENLPENARKPIGEAVGELFDAVQATIESGQMDAAGSVVLGDKQVTLLLASYSAEPQKVESALKKLVEVAQENEPDFPEVKSTRHAGVSLHTVNIPVKDEEPREVFGDTVEVVVGIGNKSVYLAAGNDAQSRIRQAIDASAGSSGKKQIAPAEIRVSLAPIFQFAATVDKNNKKVPAMAEELAKSGGKDHVTVIVSPIPNGASYRLTAEEGVLRLLGSETRAANAAADQPQQ
jgi:hypothetical protein